jgi:hypothetical protein
MTAATPRPGHDDAQPSPAASARMAGDLEVPRPLRLILTAGWKLAESAGLPVAAWAGGRARAGLRASFLVSAAGQRSLRQGRGVLRLAG